MPQTGGSNNRLILTVLKSRKFRVKVLANLVSVEDTISIFPGSYLLSVASDVREKYHLSRVSSC